MSIFSEAISVTFIGLVIVFLGLIILIVCIYAMAAAFRKFDAKAEAKTAVPAPSAPEPAPVAEPVLEVSQADDPQLIAVIAAAIAAMDASGKPLVVRSVRRVPGWNRAARAEQVYRF